MHPTTNKHLFRIHHSGCAILFQLLNFLCCFHMDTTGPKVTSTPLITWLCRTQTYENTRSGPLHRILWLVAANDIFAFTLLRFAMIRILMMMLKFSGWGGYHLRRTWLRWSTSHDVGKVSRNIFIFPDKDCWFPIGDSRLAETVSILISVFLVVACSSTGIDLQFSISILFTGFAA